MLAGGAVARRLEVEFSSDRLAAARQARAYSVLAPERRRVIGSEGAVMSGSVRLSSGQSRIAASYARVSSERQRQEQTIASQTAALRELAGAPLRIPGCCCLRSSRAQGSRPCSPTSTSGSSIGCESQWRR